MSKNENDFVFRAEDPVTETVSVEWPVRIYEIDRLREILNLDVDDDPGLECTYLDLTEAELRRIGEICVPLARPDTMFSSIGRRSVIFQGYPYMIHTSFELPLMLEGRKPLAVFGDGYPSKDFDRSLLPFDRFVADGSLVRRVIEEPMPHLKKARADLEGIRYILFALPGEEWRIDQYIASIIERDRSRPWDDDLERLEGSLLGYEDWQNDWWIAKRAEKRQADHQ
jgi:hypothetical protein